MRRIADILHEEAGMSIVELALASFIAVLVLSVGYLVLEAATKGYRRVENETIASRDASYATQRITRALREGRLSGPVPDAYSVQFKSDWNDDDNLEQIKYYIPSGSRELRVDTADNDGTNTQTVVISTHVRNRESGVPLFRYYSAVGTEISNAASRTAEARIIKIQVITSADASGAVPYTLETDLFLRNR